MAELASRGEIVAHHAPARPVSRLTSVGYFLRHFFEMVVAMLLGMAAYGLLSGMLAPLGYRELTREYPELRYGLMTVFMAVPMVLVMRYRKHSWGRGIEMAAAMAAPTAAVVLCWRLGLGEVVPLFSYGALSASAHIAMLLGMLALMIYRHGEYSHPASHASAAHASP